MLNNICRILLAAFLPLCCFAQSERRTLDWQDFMRSVQRTVIAQPVYNGRFTIFEISNINKFLYKVEVKGSVFSLNTPVPSELQTLFRLNATELQQTVENKNAQEAIAKIDGAVAQMTTLKSQKEEEAKNLEGQAQNEKQKSSADIQRLAKSQNVTIAEVKEQIDKKVKAFEKEEYAAEEVAQRLADLVVACNQYRKLSEKVAGEILELKMARASLVTIAQMDNNISEIQGLAGAVKIPPASVRTDYTALKAKFREVKSLYSQAAYYEQRDDGYGSQVRAIKDALGAVNEADELIDQEALLGLFSDAEYLAMELQNPANFRVVSPPVQMDGDLVRYAVTITPAASRALAPYRNPMEFMFEVPTRGGVKIDFSAGPYIAVGKNAKGENYFLEEVPGQTTQVLRQRPNNNAISPGLAAFMHFYPRTGRYSGFGGMVGVGAGAQQVANVNFSLFAGGSLVLGKMHKLMISSGLAYLRVDRLKENQYVVGQTYDPAKIVLDDVVEKVFRPSLFFSVTYNLSQRLDVK